MERDREEAVTDTFPPQPGKHASVGREHEDVRHKTVSILAALALHTTQIIANPPSSESLSPR